MVLESSLGDGWIDTFTEEERGQVCTQKRGMYLSGLSNINTCIIPCFPIIVVTDKFNNTEKQGNTICDVKILQKQPLPRVTLKKLETQLKNLTSHLPSQQPISDQDPTLSLWNSIIRTGTNDGISKISYISQNHIVMKNSCQDLGFPSLHSRSQHTPGLL